MRHNERIMIYTNSLKTIEYDNLAQSSKIKWLTVTRWRPLIMAGALLLAQTAAIPKDWGKCRSSLVAVDEIFLSRSEIITDSKKALHTERKSLTICAWEAHVAASGVRFPILVNRTFLALSHCYMREGPLLVKRWLLILQGVIIYVGSQLHLWGNWNTARPRKAHQYVIKIACHIHHGTQIADSTFRSLEMLHLSA